MSYRPDFDLISTSIMKWENSTRIRHGFRIENRSIDDSTLNRGRNFVRKSPTSYRPDSDIISISILIDVNYKSNLVDWWRSSRNHVALPSQIVSAVRHIWSIWWNSGIVNPELAENRWIKSLRFWRLRVEWLKFDCISTRFPRRFTGMSTENWIDFNVNFGWTSNQWTTFPRWNWVDLTHRSDFDQTRRPNFVSVSLSKSGQFGSPGSPFR